MTQSSSMVGFSLNFNQLDEITLEQASEVPEDIENYEQPPISGFSIHVPSDCYVFVWSDCLCLMNRTTKKLIKQVESSLGPIVNVILENDHLIVMHLDGVVSLLSMKQLINSNEFDEAKIWTSHTDCNFALTAAIMNDHVYIIDKGMGIVVLNMSNGSRNDAIEKVVPNIEDGIGILFTSPTEMIISTSATLELWARSSVDDSEIWNLQVKKQAAKERGYLFLFNMAYERSSDLLYVLDCDIMRVSVMRKSTLDIIKTFGEDLNLTSVCIDEEKGHLYCCYNNIIIYN